ncbi:bucky ball isoform X2 [Genypterus blacodes]|uniref:bucky ball isoform X2 n=1 Tax=Genypterus blacodes TaxID=154954 RepID=UPI003F77081C
MDDGSQQPHAFGGAQQRGQQHSRPFFYVQPASQPYLPYYQQWQMNNPYCQYGLPAGFNFGRPYMHPYQYMQYPGYVFPQSPVYPMDYRRMFEPRFQSPAWNDVPRQQPPPPQQQQQQQQQQHRPPPHHGRRDMACSEAQTDPSDAISKLIECLDKIRANELAGSERELDSGVASQSSGMFSPGEEKKSEERAADHVLPSVPDESHLQSPAVTLSDSTAAVYDGESSHRSLGTLSSQGCWSGGFDEVLPLDSSSVHEECPDLEQPAGDEQFLSHCSLEKLSLSDKVEVTDIQTDISPINPCVPKCNAEEPQRVDPILPSAQALAPCFSSSQSTPKDARSGNKIPKAECQARSWDDAKSEPSYQILKLPFDSVLAAGASRLSSPAAPYYYNYLSTQPSHERMSVLSPSLDELSSRDEMFSTDLEDMDLFPKRVYTNRLAEVVGSSPQAAEEVEGVWPMGAKRIVCACCGKGLAKGTARSKVLSSKLYQDEAGDSEEEGRYGRCCEQPVRVVVRKHSAPRKAHPLPPRHVSKPWYKRGQYKDPSQAPEQQEEGRDLCKHESADGEAGELQCRTCQDGLCREDATTSDQGRWGDGEVIPRRRQAAPLQRQGQRNVPPQNDLHETSAQRKAPCKPLMYHRPRDEENDEEELHLHWDRGSSIRGEPRC